MFLPSLNAHLWDLAEFKSKEFKERLFCFKACMNMGMLFLSLSLSLFRVIMEIMSIYLIGLLIIKCVNTWKVPRKEQAQVLSID